VADAGGAAVLGWFIGVLNILSTEREREREREREERDNGI